MRELTSYMETLVYEKGYGVLVGQGWECSRCRGRHYRSLRMAKNPNQVHLSTLIDGRVSRSNDLVSENATGRNGWLAGGIAMMAALLAIQLISRVIGPYLLLTHYFAPLTYQKLQGLSGEFARFLMSGGPHFSRIVIFLVIIFLLVGGGLGGWASRGTSVLAQRVMQAAATILFATLTLLYVADSTWLEFFLQEIAITVALSCLVYAVVLNWLLQEGSSENRWRIGGAISVLSFLVIAYDSYLFR